MNIPANNFMPVSTSIGTSQEVAYKDTRLAALMSGVRNSADRFINLRPAFDAIGDFALHICHKTGMTAMASALKRVGNGVDYTLKASGNVILATHVVDAGFNIFQKGVGTILLELMGLLKQQAFPIIDSWLRAIIDAEGRMTPIDVFKNLLEKIVTNKEIKGMFNRIIHP